MNSDPSIPDDTKRLLTVRIANAVTYCINQFFKTKEQFAHEYDINQIKWGPERHRTHHRMILHKLLIHIKYKWKSRLDMAYDLATANASPLKYFFEPDEIEQLFGYEFRLQKKWILNANTMEFIGKDREFVENRNRPACNKIQAQFLWKQIAEEFSSMHKRLNAFITVPMQNAQDLTGLNNSLVEICGIMSTIKNCTIFNRIYVESILTNKVFGDPVV